MRFCGRDGSGWQTSNLGAKIDDNQWHHIAVVRDNGSDKNRLYVDGALRVSGSHDYTADFAADYRRSMPHRFSNDETEPFFSRYMDKTIGNTH